MLKFLIGLLKGGNGRKSVAGNLAWEIREAIKGKELDPNELISIQTKINEIEAGHRTVFVAGWRPFIGWVCGVALAYNFIIRDLFIWALEPQDVPPALQMEHLMTVLLGMLGLGGLRTFEKVKDKKPIRRDWDWYPDIHKLPVFEKMNDKNFDVSTK